VHTLYTFVTDIMSDNSDSIVPGSQSYRLFKMARRATMFAGCIILFMTLGGRGKNKVFGTIIGYGFLLVGTILFMANIAQKILKSGNATAKSAMSLLITLGPFIVFIILLACIIALFASYIDRIASQNVPGSFYKLTNISLGLTLLLTYLFHKNTNSDEFKTTRKVNGVSGMTMYLVELLGFVVTLSMFIILHYFVTDGYANLE